MTVERVLSPTGAGKKQCFSCKWVRPENWSFWSHSADHEIGGRVGEGGWAREGGRGRELLKNS